MYKVVYCAQVLARPGLLHTLHIR